MTSSSRLLEPLRDSKAFTRGHEREKLKWPSRDWTLCISGIPLVARHINNDPARLRRKFTSKGYEFTSIYAENQIRTDRSLDDSWILSRAGPQKVSRSISETAGSRRIAHAAKNYRPDLKSDSYLFREKRERKGGEIWDPTFGGETLDKLLHPLPLPFSFFPSRFWDSSEKSIKSMAEAKSVVYLFTFPSSITRSHRNRCPWITLGHLSRITLDLVPRPTSFYISIRDTLADLRESNRRCFFYFSLLFFF